MLTTNFPKIENDLNEVVRSFSSVPLDVSVTHALFEGEDYIENVVTISGVCFSSREKTKRAQNEIERIRIIKRYAKILLYEALQKLYPEFHPWGSLTGIRPVKLFRFLEEKENENAEEFFKDVYKVSDDKIRLVKSIYETQKPLYEREDNGIDLYIGIPFCLSRCYYCSFISQDLAHTSAELVESYVDGLTKDILCAKQIIKANNYKLRSVYMGGGTPTSLSAKQLERVLSVCDFSVPEFTVEAGRPDTITKEKLDVISSYAGRISVNPQTIHDKTLVAIGRNHTFADFLNCYELASKYDFSINCDLIAGLSGETADDFVQSAKTIIMQKPDNITLHTLALKAGSKLKESVKTNVNDEISLMIDGGYRELFSAGYKPYYLYRQKYMAGNLENTGFFKTSPCIYNVDIMEENTSNIACGANAVSKRFFKCENRIERFAFPKDVKTYIEKLDDNLAKREKMFEKR